MDPITLSLIGAALGGMTSKKPLKGAAMGALGGYFLPGLLGAAGTAGAAGAGAGAASAGAAPTGLLAAESAIPAAMSPTVPGQATFLDKLKAVNESAKPFMQAAGAAQTAASFFPASQPVETPPPQFGGGANPVFAQFTQQLQQLEAQRMQEEMERRQAQRGLLSQMGGGYARFA